MGVGLGGGVRVAVKTWRSEPFVKIPKKKFFFWGGGGRVRGSDGGGVRVDGNGELKLL